MSDAGPLPHPRDAEAAEYVLGTLDRRERIAFETDMALDPAVAALVLRWQNTLATLAETTPSIEPSHGLLERIERARQSSSNVVMFRDPPELIAVRRSRQVWRAATAGASALAAGLAIFIALDRAPSGEVASRDLIAVVNRAGDLPALIVHVNSATGTVQVRSVAAETPADRDLELWSVAPGAAPRSLGLVRAERLPVLQAGDTLRDGITLAVSVEPRGGSTTGGPTGPVVYSGKLLPDPH